MRTKLNKRKLSLKNFYLELIKNIHPFYDGHGRPCKILLHLQLGLQLSKNVVTTFYQFL